MLKKFLAPQIVFFQSGCESRYLPDGLGDGDPNRLEHFATSPLALGPDGKFLVMIFYGNLLQGL